MIIVCRFTDALLNPKSHFEQVLRAVTDHRNSSGSGVPFMHRGHPTHTSSSSSSSSAAAASAAAKLLPDHCTLMERVYDCVGMEHLYDWFDYFVEKQTPWIVPSTDTKSGRTKMTKATPSDVLLSPSSLGKRKANLDLMASPSATHFASGITTTGAGETNDREDEQSPVPVTTSSASDQLTDDEFIQMKCRFANAMTDLQIAGVVHTKSLLAAAVVNNSGLAVNKRTDVNGDLSTASHTRGSMGVSRQCFSWMSEMHS